MVVVVVVGVVVSRGGEFGFGSLVCTKTTGHIKRGEFAVLDIEGNVWYNKEILLSVKSVDELPLWLATVNVRTNANPDGETIDGETIDGETIVTMRKTYFSGIHGDLITIPKGSFGRVEDGVAIFPTVGTHHKFPFKHYAGTSVIKSTAGSAVRPWFRIFTKEQLALVGRRVQVTDRYVQSFGANSATIELNLETPAVRYPLKLSSPVRTVAGSFTIPEDLIFFAAGGGTCCELIAEGV